MNTPTQEMISAFDQFVTSDTLSAMTKLITVEVPERALKLFGGDEARFGRQMFETAVVKWFDEGLLSQGRSSETLGITRGEFFNLLSLHNVSPIQITAEELSEELRRV